jgi:hypothetical protein
MRSRVAQRVLRGRGLRHHYVAGLGLEQHPQTAPHHGVIVGKHERDARGLVRR